MVFNIFKKKKEVKKEVKDKKESSSLYTNYIDVRGYKKEDVDEWIKGLTDEKDIIEALKSRAEQFEINTDLERVKNLEEEIELLKNNGYIKIAFHEDKVKVFKKADLEFSDLKIDVYDDKPEPEEWEKKFCVNRNRKFVLHTSIYQQSFYTFENAEKALDIWIEFLVKKD